MKSCKQCNTDKTSRWWSGPTCNRCALSAKRRAKGIPEKNKNFDKVAYKAEYYQKNKEALYKKNRQYAINNIEKTRKIKRDWAKQDRKSENSTHKLWSTNNKDKIKVYNQKYNSSKKAKISKEKWIKNNLEKINAYQKKYRTTLSYKISKQKYKKNNKEIVNFHTSIRRAQKKKAYPKWLSKEQKQLIIKQYKLAKQLTEQTGIKHEVDHIVPLVSEFVCGLHVPWNLQVIPSHENRIKSNKITHLNNETVT